jgi:uncharacterized protein (UPF0264 family)
MRMKLLVSVASADEAREAVQGGAGIIDAKDPARGALGPVSPHAFSEIRAVVGDDRLVTAALGEAGETLDIEELACDLVGRGAALVKLGLAGLRDAESAETAIRHVVRSCSFPAYGGVVAVAYADAMPRWSVDRTRVVEVAARAGARGVLVDTADKAGSGLTTLWSPAELAEWVGSVHSHGMFAAVAGKLRVGDLAIASDAGADIVGVRGAACVGGRLGGVSRDRVRELELQVRGSDDRVGEAGRKSA